MDYVIRHYYARSHKQIRVDHTAVWGEYPTFGVHLFPFITCLRGHGARIQVTLLMTTVFVTTNKENYTC